MLAQSPATGAFPKEFPAESNARRHALAERSRTDLTVKAPNGMGWRMIPVQATSSWTSATAGADNGAWRTEDGGKLCVEYRELSTAATTFDGGDSLLLKTRAGDVVTLVVQ